MKIIDLLNKIENDEDIPKKLKFENNIYYYIPKMKDYYCEEEHEWLFCYTVNRLINYNFEILDEPKEDKIEKLNDILRVDDLESPYDNNLQKIWCQIIKNHNKINEIIDKIKKDNNER